MLRFFCNICDITLIFKNRFSSIFFYGFLFEEFSIAYSVIEGRLKKFSVVCLHLLALEKDERKFMENWEWLSSLSFSRFFFRWNFHEHFPGIIYEWEDIWYCYLTFYELSSDIQVKCWEISGFWIVCFWMDFLKYFFCIIELGRFG